MYVNELLTINLLYKEAKHLKIIYTVTLKSHCSFYYIFNVASNFPNLRTIHGVPL